MRLAEIVQRISDWWICKTDAQKSVLIGTIIVIAMVLGLAQCAQAEPATTETNYGMVNSANGGVLICHLQNGVAETGVITLCMIGQNMGEMTVVSGRSVYCVVTGMKGDQPYYECGDMETVKGKLIGI